MVRTPWGDADELRAKMLRPGRGTPREEAERSQRERLFAAMVATVAKKGYGATTVADLVEASGVSRSAFYKHFADRKACFLSAVEALVEPTLKSITEGLELGDEESAEQAFDALAKLIANQPAAAKMCFEAYAAGPEGVALAEQTLERLEARVKQLLDSIPGHEGIPSEMVRALIGGIQKVIHKRLYRGEEEELVDLAPQLWGWLVSYPPPPGPLRARRRRLLKARTFEERQASVNQPERLIRALTAVVAEKGYPEATVAEIVERGRTSQRTFYEHFSNVHAGRQAGIDMISSRIVDAALPAVRRAADWRERVRFTQEEILSFWAHEPEYARFAGIEMYARGTRVLELREGADELLEDLLAPAYELAPEVPPIATEAIGGALEALVFEQVKERGTSGLLELVPACTYTCLAPFLGGEEAYAVAVEGGRSDSEGGTRGVVGSVREIG